MKRPISDETKMALLQEKLDTISGKLSKIEDSLETKYAQATELALVRLALAEMEKKFVSQDKFRPVSIIVYGACSLILTTVLGALVALVITRQA